MAVETSHRTQKVAWANASGLRLATTSTTEPTVASVVASLGRSLPAEKDVTAAQGYWAIEAGSPSTMMLRFALGFATDVNNKASRVKIFGCAPEAPMVRGLDSSLEGVWTATWMGTLLLTAGDSAVHAKSLMRPKTGASTSLKWCDTIEIEADGTLEPGMRLVHVDAAGSESANGIAAVQFDRTGYEFILVAGWCVESAGAAGDAASAITCQYANLGG